MRANRIVLLLQIIFIFTGLTALAGDQNRDDNKYYLVSKIGKTGYNADRIRYLSPDRLLMLDKKQSVIGVFDINRRTYPIINDIILPIDFDYSGGSIYLLSGKVSSMKRCFISPGSLPQGNEKENLEIMKVDSAFNLEFKFSQPSSISVDRLNRYVVIADTGALHSINQENKMFTLRFINYRPGDITFESSTRAIYSIEKTTNNLVRILTDGKLEQLISNLETDNQFSMDSKANLIILDKRNGAAVLLTNNMKMSIILQKLNKPKSITFSKDCDSIFYIAEDNNDILRVEEIPNEKYTDETLLSTNPKSLVFQKDSTLIIISGNKKSEYSSSGKLTGSIIITKKETDSLSAMNKSSAGLKPFSINNRGELIRTDINGQSEILSLGLQGFKKVLWADGSGYYVSNGKGLLIKIDSNGGKKLISKNFSPKSGIISANEKVIILRTGSKIHKLEK